jgi:hypothetical protein
MKKFCLSIIVISLVMMAHAQSKRQDPQYPVITRLEGVGAGKNFLQLADGEYDRIFNEVNQGEVIYKPGAAPIRVEVVDPTAAEEGEYIITFVDPTPGDTLSLNAFWILLNENGDTVATADHPLSVLYDQLITDLGITVLIRQSDDAGDKYDNSNGTIGYSLTYSDTAASPWLNFIPDDYQGLPYMNYVQTELPAYPNFLLDPHQAYSKFAPWVPFILTDYSLDEPAENPDHWNLTPGWLDPAGSLVQSPQFGGMLQSLNNVDIILTSDTSKWSRCVVVETGNEYYTSPDFGIGLATEGGKKSLQPRSKPSVGKYDMDNDGYPDPDGELDDNGKPLTGMGWFPGYAVDVETGKRLNIFFGENSIYGELVGPQLNVGDIGHDMIWNPGKQIFLSNIFDVTPLDAFAGGQQYVYVSRSKYDGCKLLRKDLDRTGLVKARALASVTWCAIPVTLDDPSINLLPLNDGIVPNDVTIRLRVDNPYQLKTGNGQYNDYPTYRFHLEGSTFTKQPEFKASSITIYPNPAINSITVEKINDRPGKESISIYTAEGKRIMKNTFMDQNKMEINMGRFAPWLLLFRISISIRKRNKAIYSSIVKANKPGKLNC